MEALISLGRMVSEICFNSNGTFMKCFVERVPPALARSLNSSLRTFATWLAHNKNQIPLG